MKNKLKLLKFARLAFVSLAFLVIDSQRPSKGGEIFWEELRISTSSQKLFGKVESYDEQDILWIPLSSDGSLTKQIVWEECNKSCIAWNESIDSSGNKIKPTNIEDAIELLNSQPLVASDYLPLLRLGAPVQTANIVNDLEGSRFSFYQLAPFAGGGAGGGTGNQNYIGTIDFGVNDVLQLSGFYSEADDPLFSTVVINGLADNPSNFWQSFGGGAKFILSTFDSWKIAGAGSIESWNVGSGGTLGKNQISQSGSPNIFNGQDRRVFTKNILL